MTATDHGKTSGEEDLVIRVRGLSKDYADGSRTIRVLSDVDLDVHQGEMVAIMGPSGCGKSTLLFILGLFLPPSAGSYAVGGRDVLQLGRRAQSSFRRRQVGFVFQACNLVENTTVYENLEFPLIYAGTPRGQRQGRIREALGRVNLEHRLHHRANRLSGGEQQRVAVARALVNRPGIILADEPTGQLDRLHGDLVLDDFDRCVKQDDTIVIIVTHDPVVAERCSRIYRLDDGVMKQSSAG